MKRQSIICKKIFAAKRVKCLGPMSEIWTIQRVLAWTSNYFSQQGVDSPRLTAELLLTKILDCDRVRLYIDFDRPLNKNELAQFRSLVRRRTSGEPTAYILGYREFFGRLFKVDSRVLIPRPETELLVEMVLSKIAQDSTDTFLDLCTGSGCIATTLACERPSICGVAVDTSLPALEVAKENSRIHSTDQQVQWLHGDLFNPLEKQTYRWIVSNPPYIPSNQLSSLMKEVRKEPVQALDGGPQGLVILQRIIQQSPQFLENEGWIFLEIGEQQGPAVLQMLHNTGFTCCQIVKDLAQLSRIALGFWEKAWIRS